MIKKIWSWLDGNKLTIGSMLTAIAAHVPSDVEIAGVGISGILYWLGGVIGGTGAVHKGQKLVVEVKKKIKKRISP